MVFGYIGDVTKGFLAHDETMRNRRVENAKLWASYRQQNPHATLAELTSHAEQLSGGDNYLRGGLPAGQMLESIATANAREREMEDQRVANERLTLHNNNENIIREGMQRELLMHGPDRALENMMARYPDEATQRLIQGAYGGVDMNQEYGMAVSQRAREILPTIPPGMRASDVAIFLAGERPEVVRQVSSFVQRAEDNRQSEIFAANQLRLVGAIQANPTLMRAIANGNATPEQRAQIDALAGMYGGQLTPEVIAGFGAMVNIEDTEIARQRRQNLAESIAANPQRVSAWTEAATQEERNAIIDHEARAQGLDPATLSVSERMEIERVVEMRALEDANRNYAEQQAALGTTARTEAEGIQTDQRNQLMTEANGRFEEETPEHRAALILANRWDVPTHMIPQLLAEIDAAEITSETATVNEIAGRNGLRSRDAAINSYVAGRQQTSPQPQTWSTYVDSTRVYMRDTNANTETALTAPGRTREGAQNIIATAIADLNREIAEVQDIIDNPAADHGGVIGNVILPDAVTLLADLTATRDRLRLRDVSGYPTAEDIAAAEEQARARDNLSGGAAPAAPAPPAAPPAYQWRPPVDAEISAPRGGAPDALVE